jgi:hypothetical protein
MRLSGKLFFWGKIFYGRDIIGCKTLGGFEQFHEQGIKEDVFVTSHNGIKILEFLL